MNEWLTSRLRLFENWKNEWKNEWVKEMNERNERNEKTNERNEKTNERMNDMVRNISTLPVIPLYWIENIQQSFYI